MNFAIAVSTLLSSLFLASILMLVRNNKVHEMRVEMLDQIFKCQDYKWRLSIFRGVSYDTMLFHFWKPLKPKSFYKQTDFLDPNFHL